MNIYIYTRYTSDIHLHTYDYSMTGYVRSNLLHEVKR